MSAPKLWTKDFLIISLENFFVYFTYYLLIAIIAVYATDQFHASPGIAGLTAGIFVLGAILGRLYAGSSIEQVGQKKMLYLGFIFYLVTTLFYFVANNLTLLIVIRIFHGAAFGMTSTATGTIVAKIIPNERRGEGTGYYALSTTIAAAIGPFLGMLLMQYANFSVNLMVCTVALGISFLMAFSLNVSGEKLTSRELVPAKRIKMDYFLEVKAIPISIITAIACFSYSSILSFIASYSKEINLMEAGSFFFIAYASAILVSRPFTGRWFDRKGENFVIYPAFVLFAAALLTLGQAQHSYSVLLAGVLLGLGYGNFFTSAQALAIKVSPQHRIALATSTFFIFADIGSGIGPFLLGSVIPVLGFRGLYLSMSLVVVVNIGLYYVLHGRKNRAQVLQSN